MSRKCPLCGSEAGQALLPYEQPAATCSLCGSTLPTVVMEQAPDKSDWLKEENRELFDRLMEKRNLRAARRSMLRRIGLLAGLVVAALLVYLLVL